MFLCPECHIGGADSICFILHVSRGPCEICGKVATCSDCRHVKKKED